MTKTWQEASFGLQDVIRRGSDVWTNEDDEDDEDQEEEKVLGQGVNLRKWSIKLLTRYHYAMGKSPLSRLTCALKSFD